MFGVRIGVDPSWFLILFLIIWSLSGTYGDIFPGDETQAFLLAVASALLFFVSLTLHELGHAVVAMRNGIGIIGIDLWLFGGVAKMRRETDSPGVELRVAAAGPLVTLVIVGACIAAGLLLEGSAFWEAFTTDSNASVAGAVLFYLALINAFLLVFNLIPGLPLDGGRIARAIVWKRTGDRVRATKFAARLGRGLAYVLFGLGVFALLQGLLVTGIWAIFIGFFLNQAARSAEVQTRVTARIEGLRVEDVMEADPVALPALTKLDRALEEFFLRYRFQWFPVVDGAGRFLGLVSREKVEDVPEQLRPGFTVDEVTSREDAGIMRVHLHESVESLLGSEGMARRGAVMAVDADGVLRGIVTLDRVRKALRAPTPAV